MGTTITRAASLIAELLKIGEIELSQGTIDVTSYGSTAKEFIADKLKDGGELQLEANFVPGDTNGQIGLASDFANGTVQDFVITFPNSVTWTFKGIVTKYKIVSDMKDQIKFACTIKITGQPVLGVSASNNLSGLVITTATLYPAFAAGTYDYTAVSTGASVTVTPTAAAGVITVNGNVVASGTPSSAISLGAINNVTLITIVVTEAGKAPKTYVVRVAKTA
jgi:hypothetical protein